MPVENAIMFEYLKKRQYYINIREDNDVLRSLRH